MRNSVLALGVFTACIFIGVGFLSGKETALFFLAYDNWVFGLIFTSVLIAVFSFITITYFQKFTKPQKLFKHIGFFLSIVIITVTISGAGEVFNYLLGVPSFIGCLVVCALLLLLNKNQLNAVSKACVYLIPTLLILLFSCYVFGIIKFGYANDFTIKNQPISPFLPNLTISAITYSGFGVLTCTGVFKANANRYFPPVKKTASIIISALLLLIFSVLIAFLIGFFPISASENLPSIFAVKNLSFPLFIVMCLFMILNAFSLSATHFLALETPSKTQNALIIVGCFLLGLCGFSKIISVAYPLIGWCGVGACFYFLYKILK